MSIDPTTNRTLRLEMEAEILKITPTHERDRSVRWNLEPTLEHVASAAPRHFHTVLGPPTRRSEGLQGGRGIEYEALYTVRASYGDMKLQEASDMASDDNNDIRDALRLAGVQNQITGLVDVVEPGIDFLNEENGAVLLEHVFVIRQLRDNRQ